MIEERYPGWDVLSQRGYWDDATRRVVLDRVHNVPPYTFFSAHQQATLEALCERVLPQSHRPPERRIPIGPWIDEQCSDRVTFGFRYDDMPSNEVAWVWGLEGLDQTATALFGASFRDLPDDQQGHVLRAIREGHPPGDIWRRMPARRWWVNVALRQITGVYYAHPYAWSEIGFGGPAYPRGYAALSHGAPEPWEPRETGEDDRSRR